MGDSNLPSVPLSGSIGWGDQLNLLLAQLSDRAIYRGAGSPQGVVAAPAGAVYVDTAATLGAVVWTKLGGAGNTGWVVSVGDTGWRSVGGLFTSGGNAITPSGGFALIKRVNSVVWLVTENLTFSGQASGMSYQLSFPSPSGWRSPHLANQPVGAFSVGVYHMLTLGYQALPQLVATSSAGQPFNVHTSYMVDDAWPTALPGN